LGQTASAFSKHGRFAAEVYRHHLSQQGGDIAMLSQDCNFFAILTPRKALELAAILEFLKRKKNDAKIKDNLKAVSQRKLSLLGLSSVADRRIGDRTKIGANTVSEGLIPKAKKLISKVTSGGLSGGERRRLSVTGIRWRRGPCKSRISQCVIFIFDEQPGSFSGVYLLTICLGLCFC
jgi:ABC-type multidrug transport system ATPase subunit